IKERRMKTITIMALAWGGLLATLKLIQSVLMYYGMSFEATRWIICPLGLWMLFELFWYFTPEENKQWVRNTWLPKKDNK
ncbi:hypothetical protein ACLHZ0_20235, partial [Aeromonas salmonicida]|uniref:hypothetical protein n=1 Tax=Aeromonas salmonicida TaxID=645 RepID=UPI003D00F838